MAVSKRLDNAGSTCQGFLRTCLAQCAKSRPTILTCGAKAFDSGRTDSLPRRPRLTSPARNSDDALSLTNISVIMHMCAASFTVPMLLGCFAGIIFYIVESRFVLHEDALLTHGRGDAQQPAPCQGCAPAEFCLEACHSSSLKPQIHLIGPNYPNPRPRCVFWSYDGSQLGNLRPPFLFDVQPCLLALELGPRHLSIHHCQPLFPVVQLLSDSCRWLHPFLLRLREPSTQLVCNLMAKKSIVLEALLFPLPFVLYVFCVFCCCSAKQVCCSRTRPCGNSAAPTRAAPTRL
jgi:hypothetical protein